MITALPKDSLETVFRQLEESASEEDKNIWRVGPIKFEWREVGVGDCGGRDIDGVGTESENPSTQKCEQSFVGNVAVCWDNGSYKNGARRWCTYKNITPDTCRGGANVGRMYQCVSTARESGPAPK